MPVSTNSWTCLAPSDETTLATRLRLWQDLHQLFMNAVEEPIQSDLICLIDFTRMQNPSDLVVTWVNRLKRKMPRHGHCIVFRREFGLEPTGRFVAVPTEDPKKEGKLDEQTLIDALKKR